MSKKVTTQSPEETVAFAESLANDLQHGGVILLHGELGSGKTHFVQGLARGLGVAGRVHSPTFSLVHEYNTHTHKPIASIVHVDLYRLDDIQKVHALDLPRYASKNNVLLVVEWPNKIEYAWPNVLYNITFSIEPTLQSGRCLTID